MMRSSISDLRGKGENQKVGKSPELFGPEKRTISGGKKDRHRQGRSCDDGPYLTRGGGKERGKTHRGESQDLRGGGRKWGKGKERNRQGSCKSQERGDRNFSWKKGGVKLSKRRE